FAIVDAVTVLVAYDGLHAGLADEIAHRKKFGARKRDGFLKGDQLRAAVDAELDHVEAHARRRAEAEDFRLRRKGQRTGIAAGRSVAQFAQRVLQARRVTARNTDQLEARVGLEERGVV